LKKDLPGRIESCSLIFINLWIYTSPWKIGTTIPLPSHPSGLFANIGNGGLVAGSVFRYFLGLFTDSSFSGAYFS
jgi:hypothetical protein